MIHLLEYLVVTWTEITFKTSINILVFVKGKKESLMPKTLWSHFWSHCDIFIDVKKHLILLNPFYMKLLLVFSKYRKLNLVYWLIHCFWRFLATKTQENITKNVERICMIIYLCVLVDYRVQKYLKASMTFAVLEDQ